MGLSRAKSSVSRIFGRLRILPGGRMVVMGLRTIEGEAVLRFDRNFSRKLEFY